MCLFNPFCFSVLDMLVLQQGWFELQQWYTGSPLKLHVFWVLRLAHGHGRKNLIFSRAFISPVQTSLLSWVSRAGLHTVYGIPYNECARSQINPCSMKALYHNCVFNSINWITGGAQVTVLEWKWWASVTVARPPFQLWQVNNLIDFPWRLAGLFDATFPV